MRVQRVGWIAVAALTCACSTPEQPSSSTAPATPAAAPVPAPTAGRLFVSNENSGDLSVIDVATQKVVATIPVGKRPRGVRLSRDGSRVFVALSGSPIAPPGVDE